jgi:cell division protein FtsL
MVKNGTKINKLFLWFLFPVFLSTITVSGAEAQSRKVKQAERNYQQQLKKEQKDYDKRRKAALKHRYSIQSKEVKERMKETEKRSKKYGRKKKDPFYKNIFKRKRKRRKARR